MTGPSRLTRGAILTLLAVSSFVAWGCGPTGGAPRAMEQPAAASPTAADTASGMADELDPEPTDSLPLHRWRAGAGDRVVGAVPGDVLDDLIGAGVVGRDGVALWRLRGDAGDAYVLQPWLVRPGRTGTALVPPDVHLFSVLARTPAGDRFLLSAGRGVRVFDAAGGAEREIAVDTSAKGATGSLAVHPTDGRLALLAWRWTDADTTPTVVPLDLVVLGADGAPRARVERLVLTRYGEVTLEVPTLHWLPDGRLALLAPARDDATRGDEGPRGMLLLVDPVRGRVDTTAITASAIDAVSPRGAILLDDGRLVDPATGAAPALSVPEGVSTSGGRFSPDGRLVTAVKWLDGGARMLGVLRLSDGAWEAIGVGTAVDWAPDGALYWVGARSR